MERSIPHSDMNAFYASVECLYHPALRDRPVSVGDAEQRHGIILAKNQHAKERGVRTGEAIWRARQKNPGLVTLRARYNLYMQFSKMEKEIYGQYTGDIESLGFEE